MAGVEPYAPCPCGSGRKYKWCCQKVEPVVEKAQRLVEGGQVQAAIKTLEEGLRKEPGNPWLLTRRAVFQLRQGDAESAKAGLRQILEKDPKHFGALILLTRCILETEGPVNGAGMFQHVLATVEEEQWKLLGVLARVVAVLLVGARRIPAALKHFDLMTRLGEDDPSSARQIESSPEILPWLKDRLTLAQAPGHLDEHARGRFARALSDAERGLWAPAAAAFDALASGDPGGEADYNLGLCRLWLGDEAGAIGPIRARSRRLGPTPEAVNLEALCQVIEPIHPDDRVENLQLLWPIRNREALLAALRSKPDIAEDEPEPIDPEAEESPEAEAFTLLDKPALRGHDGRGLAIEQVPRVLGRVLVGPKDVALETFDDGRVNALGDRFTALAGSAIAPAHPRTVVLGVEARSQLALIWERLYPDEIDPADAERLDLEMRGRMIRDAWPVTPMPYLGMRTPEKAARDRDAAIPLRAAICRYNLDRSMERGGFDFQPIRDRLGLESEPALDPSTVDIEKLPLARLVDLPAGKLDDDRLITLYRRALRAVLGPAIEAAALAIIERPSLFDANRVDAVAVYSNLADLAMSRGQADRAIAWIEAGERSDSPARRIAHAPAWDMIDIRIKARSERPEVWVPELAVVLERYAGDPSANQVILMNLVDLGLVRIGPNPDDPEDILLDSRPLQSVMAEYGPRVTTSSGRLGVSATRPEVWTPGGPASGGGGGLWTPGSGSGNPPEGDKPKLILPGR